MVLYRDNIFLIRTSKTGFWGFCFIILCHSVSGGVFAASYFVILWVCYFILCHSVSWWGFWGFCCIFCRSASWWGFWDFLVFSASYFVVLRVGGFLGFLGFLLLHTLSFWELVGFLGIGLLISIGRELGSSRMEKRIEEKFLPLVQEEMPDLHFRMGFLGFLLLHTLSFF